MTEPVRITPEKARERLQTGSAILVCGYDDEDKWRKNMLEGAISFGDFVSRLPSIGNDQEIIVYCA
ncbi:MAG: rhodanese-like domain-containing protein [Desulfobacterales bacterium]